MQEANTFESLYT